MGSWATSRRHAAKATPATSAKVTIILSFIVFSPDTCSAIAPPSLPVHNAQIKDAAADLGVLQVGWCGNATSSSASACRDAVHGGCVQAHRCSRASLTCAKTHHSG